MLEILKRLNAENLDVRYCVTRISLEHRMFGALLTRCSDNGYAPGEDNEFEGVVLAHDPSDDAGLSWVSLKQNDHRLVMSHLVPNDTEHVLVACTSQDWLSFMMMCYTPHD